MKFLLLKWLTKPSSLWMLDLSQWKQVIELAENAAKDSGLDLINIGLEDENLEIFLFGNKHKIKNFINEFRFELYFYLRTINKKYDYRALSNLYLIEEIGESDSRLIQAVRDGLQLFKIYKIVKVRNQSERKDQYSAIKSQSPP